MDCPVCHCFIPISPEMLLTQQAIECPHCRLRLEIDSRQSQAAREALMKVEVARQRVEAASRFRK